LPDVSAVETGRPAVPMLFRTRHEVPPTGLFMEERQSIVILSPNRKEPPPSLPNSINRHGLYESIERLGVRVDFVDVNRWPWNPFATWHALFASIDPVRAVYVLLRKRAVMAVLSNFESGSLIILALRHLLRFRPLVVIFDTGAGERNWRLGNWITGFCIRRADAVYTLASEQAKSIRAKYQPRGQIEFIHQQTDTEFFSPAPEEEQDFILSVGDDVSRDFATLIAATEGLDLRVVLRTRSVRESQSAFPNITVIRKRLSDGSLRDLYRRARIVVLPLKDTLHPGGITTLLEAFACGRAVIVSLSRGVRDYVADGENCLVVPCGEVAALRKAILRLIADDRLRARLSRGARAYAEREVSQAVHAKKLMASIGGLVLTERNHAAPGDRLGTPSPN
jgi:glycosyltransferase involved in cell wall biosynthesis